LERWDFEKVLPQQTVLDCLWCVVGCAEYLSQLNV